MAFAGLTTVAFFGVVEGALSLAGLRPLVVEQDPYVGFAQQIPLFVPDGEFMTTAENKLPWFNAQRFPRNKAHGTYRIVCLGGSTTYGRPYSDATSFCGWLREFLPRADPSRQWEVINAGGISYASYRVAAIMQEMAQYKPDLFIVYVGHNEFLEHRTCDTVREASPIVRQLNVMFGRTRTYTAVRKFVGATVSAPRSATNLLPGEVATRLDQGVGPDAYTRDRQLEDQILRHFELNLIRLVDMAQAIGARIVLSTPASNLSDCSPFKSELGTGLELATQNQLHQRLARSKHLLTTHQRAEALAEVEAALLLDDQSAEMHYQHGKCLQAIGEHQRAKQAYVHARDEDICPLRAITKLQQAVREVATRKRVGLVDFAQLTVDLSPHNLPGANLFLDHVHPTVEGHRQLALALLKELVQQGIVREHKDWNTSTIEEITQTVIGRIDRKAQGEALRNLAKVFAWAGKQEEADRMALQAAELIANDLNTLYLAANAQIDVGQLDEAIDRLQQVLRADGGHVRALSSLGVAYQKQGQLDEARRYYELAMQRAPEDAAVLNNLGAVHEQLDELERAEVLLRKAIQVNPRYAKAHHNLGVVYIKQQSWKRGLESLHRAVTIDPDFGRAHADLGAVYKSQANATMAVFHLRRALQIDPTRLQLANSLAWLLATNTDDTVRDGAEALRWAMHCAEGTSYENPGVFNTLAAAYAETGDFDKAMEWQTKALRVAPEAVRPQCEHRLTLYRSGKPCREP